jgi:CDP-diacylglycerol--glycerol-3-phosphate 3-phosphatidyltransferase
MHSIANIITGIRIVGSVIMLFCQAFSPAFYSFYIVAGVSDMIDGIVARKTGTASEFGSKFDTVADIVFVAVCLIKMIPVIDVPSWIFIWIVIIAFIKVANIAAGYIRQREFIPVHSIINKVTGAMLFAFPLTLTFIDLKYSSAVVCLVATVAAIQEGYLINRNVMNSSKPLPG